MRGSAMPLRKLAAELGRAAAMQKRAVGAADLAGSALGRKVLAEAGVIPANLVGAGLPADVMGGLYGKTWDVAAKLPGSSALVAQAGLGDHAATHVG